MVSSTEASTLIRRPTTDTPAPADKIVVTSEAVDKVCHVCRKQIVSDRELSTQIAESCTAAISSAPSPESTESNLVCNICLNGCQEPVVTHCGHLFCWPCLFWRLSQQSGPSQLQCPVCKANVQDKIIPLYDHSHGVRQADHSLVSEVTVRLFPNKKIPCRPLPSRVLHLPPDIGIVAETADYYGVRDADLDGRSDGEHNQANSQGRIAQGALYYSYVNESPSTSQRRYSSEKQFLLKQFLLHWAFLCVASIATFCFTIA